MKRQAESDASRREEARGVGGGDWKTVLLVVVVVVVGRLR